MTATVASSAALAATWARAHLLDLEDDLDAGLGDRPGLTRHIIDISLRFNVLCRFTACVAIDHAAVIDAAGPIRRVIQPVDLPAGWDPAAVGIARRAASPIAFRRARAAETRRGERDDAIGGTDAPVFQELWEMVGRLEQRAARLTPRPNRLRQLGKLIVQLQTLLRRARPLTLSDPGE